MTSTKAQSCWIPLLGGRLTAIGAPSPSGLRAWVERGATDLVTLLRTDEMRPSLPGECQKMGIDWWHLPLSGRKLQRRSDQESLARIPELLRPLQAGRSLLLHCAAGLHRTGLSFYLLLRCAGHSPQEALALITEARALTAQELLKRTRRSGRLIEQAESLFVVLGLGARD